MTHIPGFGIQVDRPAAADDQNATTNLFQILGGLVLVRALIGMRTVVQAGGASNQKFSHSIGPTDICANGAVTGNAIGTTYTITGNATDALQIGAAGIPLLAGLAGGLLATGNNMQGLFMYTGYITTIHSAAGGTGSTAYSLWYYPITAGATIVNV